MAPYAGRPHWGKQPRFLERDRLRELYPRFGDFVDVRRRLDPGATLLNPELAALLA